jgi:SAM-dependent methyltransferase
MTCIPGIYCILSHLPMPAKDVFQRADEEAGAREAFDDAALYDFEYRRRRADINFYRRLADDRRQFAPVGPVLDLACGTGRLLVPLLRDGHTVVGLDQSAPMLAAASRRVARLSATRRSRCLLLRADLRAFACRPRFALAVAAFHSVQHIYAESDLQRFLRATRASLVPGGWFAFDVLPPDPAWISRDPLRRWGRTVFHHPVSGQRLVYTNNHRFDPRRHVLHMRLYYQPLDEQGRPSGPERVVRLCHRQLEPALVKRLLARTGFRLLACFGGFDGRPLDEQPGLAEEHVYVAAAR